MFEPDVTFLPSEKPGIGVRLIQLLHILHVLDVYKSYLEFSQIISIGIVAEELRSYRIDPSRIKYKQPQP